MAAFSFIQPIQSPEVNDLADDVREIFEELDAARPSGEPRGYTVDCHPALDVLETDENVQVVMDLAGVPPSAVRVLFRANVLIIAGEKARSAPGGPQTFHLIEREFGRFARGVRLNGAFDVQEGRATIRDGELIVVLPKLDDRRGRAHRIDITTESNRRA
jgi:HSP20 family protein